MESYGLHGDQQRNLRWFTWLVLLAQLLGLTAVILVAVWMGHFRSGFAWQENPGIEFNYHPLFMIIGMIFLYADGKGVCVWSGEGRGTVISLHVHDGAFYGSKVESACRWLTHKRIGIPFSVQLHLPLIVLHFRTDNTSVESKKITFVYHDYFCLPVLHFFT